MCRHVPVLQNESVASCSKVTIKVYRDALKSLMQIKAANTLLSHVQRLVNLKPTEVILILFAVLYILLDDSARARSRACVYQCVCVVSVCVCV